MNEDRQMQKRDARSQKLVNAGRWRQALPSLVGLLAGVAAVIYLGFILVGIVLSVVVVVQQTFGKQSWREGEEDVAGVQECPHCGSLQTDRVERFDAKGSEYEQMHCFACDTDIGDRVD